MKVLRHKLVGDDGADIPFRRSPNSSGAVLPEYLIIHYTAGRDAASSIEHLCNRASQASAHVVIGRDGSVTQLVPFDRIAWHAGRSRWNDRDGLNRYSLGIELDNAGRMERQANRWRPWFLVDYPDNEVMEAAHRNQPDQQVGWHLYTPEQIDAAVAVATTLVRRYELLEVLGHDDVAPQRKVDPGPAFPMASFRARVLGRREDHDLYRTTDIAGEGLNLRSGPGADHPTVTGSPLPRDTWVRILDQHGEWRQIDVLDVVNGVNDLQGWVHGRYLVPNGRDGAR